MLDELRDLEHRGWRSLCDGTGAGFYGRIMTSDGVMVLAHGQVLDRQAVIDSLNEAPPWREYDIPDERLVAMSEDHAILVYTGCAYRDEGEPAFIALMSSVYTHQTGQENCKNPARRPASVGLDTNARSTARSATTGTPATRRSTRSSHFPTPATERSK